MNFKTLAVVSWACLLGTAAIAGEEYRTRIEIDVDVDDSGHQSFFFDNQEAGFDLHSMAVGESRTLTDESGNTADVLRTHDGFEFNVEGRTIDLKELHEPNGLHVDHGDVDVVLVKDLKKVKMLKTYSVDGVTVISSDEIDAATRERIREALKSSGHDGEVLFVDDSEFDVDRDTHAHGRHEVRVIKKEVDVTN